MKAFKYKNKVTIVVLTKNEGQGIKQIIQSLKPYADDILVVDGHSRDNTKEIVRQEKVRYFLDHGLGRGDGVRIGIQNAKHNFQSKVLVGFYRRKHILQSLVLINKFHRLR